MKKRSLLILTCTVLFLLINSSCNENSSGSEGEETGLIWNDEFDGDRLDYDKWYPETGGRGWGNNELQNYTAIKNTEVSEGTLKITARREEDGVITSARLNSIPSFTYGRMEVRAKLPDYKGKGLWPAIWMLGDGIRNGTPWPDCGEIDIMEYVSYNPGHFYSTIHSAANNHIDGTQLGSGPVSLPDIEEEFNIFGIIWTPDDIKFYVEEQSNIIFRFRKPQNANEENWPFDKPHYFLLNTAVGGSWGGAQGVDEGILPAVFEIDYVRVYELDEE